MDTMTEPSQQDSEISTTLESAPAPEGYAPWSGHVPAQGRRTPVTTYRLQMGSTLTFDDARRLVPYLRDLGVTDVYLSPVPAATFKIPHVGAMTNIGPQWETIGCGTAQTRPGPGNAYIATFPGPE